jgi:hypothetical protein
LPAFIDGGPHLPFRSATAARSALAGFAEALLRQFRGLHDWLTSHAADAIVDATINALPALSDWFGDVRDRTFIVQFRAKVARRLSFWK